ncbi:hypothetical protein AABD41_00035 [Staphylococcus pseudoxylosus]
MIDYNEYKERKRFYNKNIGRCSYIWVNVIIMNAVGVRKKVIH